MLRSRRAVLGAIAGGIGVLGGCTGSGGMETELIPGIVPDVDPDTTIERNTALADYLETELDLDITLRTSSDYASMVQAMTARQVDLAYFGGVSYTMAHERAGGRAIAVGSLDGSTKWESAVIAHSGGLRRLTS